MRVERQASPGANLPKNRSRMSNFRKRGGLAESGKALGLAQSPGSALERAETAARDVTNGSTQRARQPQRA